MIGKKYLISEMKQLNKDNGGYYFDRNTMKCFNSKVEATYVNGFFIDSIDNFDRTCKLYKVCLFTYKADVLTIDMFYTKCEAQEFIKSLNKAIKEFGYREQLTFNECNWVSKIEDDTMYEFISDNNKDNPSYSFTIDSDFKIRG